MEEEWRVYLKEHRPDLYEQMIQSIAWSINWRDKEIAKIKAELKAKDEKGDDDERYLFSYINLGHNLN